MNCRLGNSYTISTPNGHVSWPGCAAIALAISGALPKLMLRTGLSVQDASISVTSKKYCRNWLFVEATCLPQSSIEVNVSSPLKRRWVEVASLFLHQVSTQADVGPSDLGRGNGLSAVAKRQARQLDAPRPITSQNLECSPMSLHPHQTSYSPAKVGVYINLKISCAENKFRLTVSCP